MGYTWAQFCRYLDLARMREAQQRAADLVVANRAFAGGDSATKLLQTLNREAEGQD